MNVLKLRKPLELDGNNVTEMNYDLDSLTAKNIQNAVRELGFRSIAVTVQETDLNFHAALFAEAAEVNMDDLDKMSAKDYLNAGLAVRDFFYFGMEESSPSTSSGTQELKSQSTPQQDTTNAAE